MAIPESEAIACLEVLVAIMKADGRVDAGEKKSLVAALESFELAGTSVEKLLDAPVDLDAALAKITSDEGRAQSYRSAFFMANADGQCGKAESDLLAKVASALGTTDADKARVAQIFGKPKGKVASLLDSLSSLFRKR